jgi:hypothetical protein
VARWGNIAGEAARSVGFWLILGLITYLGMNAVIKIEATGPRLFLAVVVFGVAYGAASLLEHVLRLLATRQSGRTEMRWPQWLLSRNSPVVQSKPNTGEPTYYVVLPMPSSSRVCSRLAGRRQV